MTIRNILVAVLCNLFLSSLGTFASIEKRNVTIQDLIDIAASRPSINGIDITFEKQQVVPDNFTLRGSVPLFYQYQHLLVDKKHGWYYQDKIVQNTKSGEKEHLVSAHDGEFLTVFHPDGKRGSISKGQPLISLMEEECLSNDALMRQSRNEVYDGSIVSMLKNGILRPKKERVGNCDTMVVDVYFQNKKYATMWLDVERGMIPLQLIVYDTSGKEKVIQKITELRQLDDGLGNKMWFPITVECVVSFKNGNVLSKTKADPEKIRINPPIDRKTFRIAFPRGSAIDDKVANLEYKIPDDSFYEEPIKFLNPKNIPLDIQPKPLLTDAQTPRKEMDRLSNMGFVPNHTNNMNGMPIIKIVLYTGLGIMILLISYLCGKHLISKKYLLKK